MSPRLSIIIPVLDEAAIINAAVGRLAAVTSAVSAEIIVADGDPAGGTLAVIADESVKKISSPPGRGAQMNAGAQAASGEILLFLHADTCLPSGAERRIMAVCEDSAVAGGAFDLAIDSHRCVFRIIEKAASLRSRLTKIPYGDQAIFIKTDIFRSLGGYRNLPLMEDIDLMRQIKRHGCRIRLVRPPVLTSARRWETEGILYATARNLCLSTLFYLGVSAERLKRHYQ